MHPLEAHKHVEQHNNELAYKDVGAVPLKAPATNAKASKPIPAKHYMPDAEEIGYAKSLSATTITRVNPVPAVTGKIEDTPLQRTAKHVVKAIAAMTAQNDANENMLSKGMWSGKDTFLIGSYSYVQSPALLTDTDTGSAKRFNMFVSNAATLNVDEKQAADFDNYEAFVIDRLMDNFVSGNGPENYNFPTNGVISSKFLQSDILKAALKDFNAGVLEPGKPRQYSFGKVEFADDVARTGTVLSSITGFAGSGDIIITPAGDDLQIKIFNITSLTSGDLLKNPTHDAQWPTSFMRDPKKITPYGNISQTYNLLIPYDRR